jgi:hypothetical protein
VAPFGTTLCINTRVTGTTRHPRRASAGGDGDNLDAREHAVRLIDQRRLSAPDGGG